MILIKVQCIGINPPIIKTYFLRDSIDEIIFFNTLNKINTKLKRKLPINLDEALWFYSGYLINLIKKNIPLDKIKKDNNSQYQNIKTPTNTTLKGMDRVQQVKKMEDFVFMVVGN